MVRRGPELFPETEQSSLPQVCEGTNVSRKEAVPSSPTDRWRGHCEGGSSVAENVGSR